MKIQVDLLLLKAVNFFSQAALASFLPFKSILQKQLGISEAQNGIIMALDKAVSLIAPSLLGGFADKCSAHKLVMIACAIFSALIIFPIYFLPTNNSQHVILVTNESCEIFGNKNASFDCSSLNLSFESCAHSCRQCNFHCNAEDTYDLTFFVVLLLSMLFSMATVPLSSLIDATTMYVLGNERLHLYGKQRLWGAVGFGLVGAFVGLLIDVYTNFVNQPLQKNYLLSFVSLILFQFITAVVVSQLKVPINEVQSICKGLCNGIKNNEFLFLLLIVFLSGFNLGTRYAFTFWYVEQLPGANPTLLGLSVFTGCFSEIPVFFISGWILKKIGYQLTLSIGLLTAGLQCYLYTIIPVAWPLLCIETLHGISFALPMAAMCTHAAQLAPEGMAAVFIGLTQGIYWGLGNMVGALTSGVLYKSYGPEIMFHANAVISLVGSFAYYFMFLINKNFCKPGDDKGDNVQIEMKNPMLKNSSPTCAQDTE